MNKLFKSNNSHVIGQASSNNLEIGEVLLIIIGEGEEPVRLGTITNIINNIIVTDQDIYTMHSQTDKSYISIRNLYQTSIGIAMVMYRVEYDELYNCIINGETVLVSPNQLFELTC